MPTRATSPVFPLPTIRPKALTCGSMERIPSTLSEMIFVNRAVSRITSLRRDVYSSTTTLMCPLM